MHAIASFEGMVCKAALAAAVGQLKDMPIADKAACKLNKKTVDHLEKAVPRDDRLRRFDAYVAEDDRHWQVLYLAKEGSIVGLKVEEPAGAICFSMLPLSDTNASLCAIGQAPGLIQVAGFV